MPIINKQPAIVKREYAIEEPVALVVERYAAFIQSNAGLRCKFGPHESPLPGCRIQALGETNNRGPRAKGLRKPPRSKGRRHDPEKS